MNTKFLEAAIQSNSTSTVLPLITKLIRQNEQNKKMILSKININERMERIEKNGRLDKKKKSESSDESSVSVVRLNLEIRMLKMLVIRC